MHGQLKRFLTITFLKSLTVLCLIFLSAHNALGVPSYARQTGLPCSGCHSDPPELNAAGRSFKLLGYVDKKKEGNITAESEQKARWSGLTQLASSWCVAGKHHS